MVIFLIFKLEEGSVMVFFIRLVKWMGPQGLCSDEKEIFIWIYVLWGPPLRGASTRNSVSPNLWFGHVIFSLIFTCWDYNHFLSFQEYLYKYTRNYVSHPFDFLLDWLMTTGHVSVPISRVSRQWIVVLPAYLQRLISDHTEYLPLHKT